MEIKKKRLLRLQSFRGTTSSHASRFRLEYHRLGKQCQDEFASTNKRFLTPFSKALLTAAGVSSAFAQYTNFHVKLSLQSHCVYGKW